MTTQSNVLYDVDEGAKCALERREAPFLCPPVIHKTNHRRVGDAPLAFLLPSKYSMEVVVNKLREARLGRHLSQVQLSCLSGLANSSISDFETGKRQPWPRARRAISRALGVKEDEIFDVVTPAGR